MSTCSSINDPKIKGSGNPLQRNHRAPTQYINIQHRYHHSTKHERFVQFLDKSRLFKQSNLLKRIS